MNIVIQVLENSTCDADILACFIGIISLSSVDTQIDQVDTITGESISDNDSDSLIETNTNARGTIAETRAKRVTRPINRF